MSGKTDLRERGLFVCFEGIDGAGKTTAANRLVEALRTAGETVFLIDKSISDFPEGFSSRQMTLLKAALWDYPKECDIGVMGDQYWLHSIVAWYSALYRCKVQPLLVQGSWVVADGWIYKFWARFRLKPDFGDSFLASCFAHIPEPDLVLLLDVPPAVAVQRRSVFKPSEMGRSDNVLGPAAESFVRYQSVVRESLLIIASTRRCWRHLEVHDHDEERVLTHVRTMLDRSS